MNDFSSYKFEDFISNPSFYNYAKGLDPEDVRIWKEWIAKNPGNIKVASEARDFIAHLIPNRRFLPKRFIDSEWNRLMERLNIDGSKKVASAPSKGKFKMWHYAASIALFISLLGVLLSKTTLKQDTIYTENVVVVPKGEIRKILLPDNTLVFLNSDTRFSYNSGFGEKFREVHLEGEAYFDVAHNADIPFIVHTLENDIKVIGTSFNVKAYPDEAIHQIALERGKITVSDQNQKSYKLDPNQTYLLLRSNGSAKAFRTENIKDYSSWTEGKIIFRNRRFVDVAKDFERSYNVVFEIQNKQILDNRYTGEFSRDDNIMNILEIIRKTSYFEFKVEGDTIIIK